jgi:thiol-disulfide isomerase/thioredoxin
MKLAGKSKSLAIALACAAAGTLLLTRPFNTVAATGAASVPGSDNSLSGGALGNAPTSQPSEETPAKSLQELSAQYVAGSRQLGKLVPQAVLADPQKRAAAAPKAIPVAYHLLDIINQVAATKQVPAPQVDQMRQNVYATLYLLDDQSTVAKVKDMTASTNAGIQMNGKAIELQSRWISAGTNADEQQAVADDLEKMAKEHPTSSKITLLMYGFAMSTPNTPVRDRLLAVVSDTMTDPIAKQITAQTKAQAAAEAKQKNMIDKPLVITEKTVDGKDFSTDSLKGKVVLVDFWATWCGPCKASLPHVKEIYSKYHDQGLEIVGIDNDYDADTVTAFTAKENMPWTQLMDSNAASNHQWNPLSQQYGVNGIPCMFLIDKKGVLRSVTARADMDTLIPKLLAE